MKRLSNISYTPTASYAVVAVLASVAGGWLAAKGIYHIAAVCIPIIIFAVYRILRLYGTTIRRVTFMFNAIDSDDLSFRFNENPETADIPPLNAALNRIKEILQHAKLQAEERERYYQLIMECARTGIITINDAGSVYQANDEALRIFGLQRMTHIRQLETMAPEICKALKTIRPGDRLHASCITETGEISLTLGCSEITLDQQRLRVVSVSDINSEINQVQIESWSKLTRILTHEIMNSLAPITSLSDTLLRTDKPLDAEIERGLETISATSRRLTMFVESFRRFTRIPEPHKEPFEVTELLNQAVILSGTNKADIDISVDVDPVDTMIYADKTLMGQVAVNLIKNACEAVSHRQDGRIEIRSRIDPSENVTIEFSNNGGAIPTDIAENIFTPFFSTKPDGSGIGLSISRRIVQMHGGSLYLSCNTDKKVTFTLKIA